MMTQTLEIPPFPVLRWKKFFWTGEVVLASWAGFQTRRGPYASVSSGTLADGGAGLTVTPKENKSPTPPTAEQVRAFQYLLDHEREVADVVAQAILDAYPAMKESYAEGYSDEEADELLPDIERADQLRPMIGLSHVHVLAAAKNGFAYVGFEFGCIWDREHGLGVMTHMSRVVAGGGADSSFLAWIAERDAKKGK